MCGTKLKCHIKVGSSNQTCLKLKLCVTFSKRRVMKSGECISRCVLLWGLQLEWLCVHSQSAGEFTYLLGKAFIYLSVFPEIAAEFLLSVPLLKSILSFLKSLQPTALEVSYIATPVSTEQAQAPSKLSWKGLRTGFSKIQGSWIYSS